MPENRKRLQLKKEGFISISKGRKSLRLKLIECSPCSVECPLDTNVKSYVSLISAGRFAEALEVVRLTNPFPGICGRVCPHPCEDKCLRGDIDEPISVAALKRFLADYELCRGIVPRYERLGRSQGRVAVIGAGPAGLTCASDLAREGYEVTVFEALPAPGGMMAFGIPSYRLPKDILQSEIAAIEALGIEIKLNTRVGLRPKFHDLIKQFDAVFIATGAAKPRKLGILGEKDVQEGLVDWVSLLREAALGGGEKPGDKVVIIGSGNTAVDCARVMLRLGVKDVQIVYRRSREEMPAYKDEVADAEEEGVRIHFLAAPVRFLLEKGQLVAVECVHMRLGKRDKSGRRRAIPIQNSRFVISCDAIIPAIGQELDTSFLGVNHGLSISDEHLLVVDLDTMVTIKKGVFAGGDAITGSASVLDAIAAGHRAAKSIGYYIKGLPVRYQPVEIHPDLEELTLEIQPTNKMLRSVGSRLNVRKRRDSFGEVDLGLTEAQAIAEAKRCIRCGPCYECNECVAVCDMRQLIIAPSVQGYMHTLHKNEMLIRVSPDIQRKVIEKGVASVRYQTGQYETSIITAMINEHLCRGCGLCEEICGYRAIQVIYRGNGVFSAQVDEDMCRGCGTCVAVCPSGALEQNHFTAERINHLISVNLQKHRDKLRVVIFACHWSAAFKYASDRLPYEVVSVMCTGRVVSGDVLKAFERGASGVLIVGCASNDCHYGFGSDAAGENLKRLSDVLSLLGFGRKRLRIVQFSAEGGLSLADEVKDFLKEIKKL